MKQIIRVEHTDGIGMFGRFMDSSLACLNFCPSLSQRHNDLFPDPLDDGLYIAKDDYCAFKSIEQIQKWIFPDEFDILFKYVYLIKVSQWKEGSHQVLYKKQHILSKVNISNLFKNETKHT